MLERYNEGVIHFFVTEVYGYEEVMVNLAIRIIGVDRTPGAA